MSNQAHVLWLHHSKVYHRATALTWDKFGRSASARCGSTVYSTRFRAMEATEHEARRLGLRPCRRCWRQRKEQPQPA